METTRYNKQTMLPEIGLLGQQKLQQAKILVVGAGGLGSAVLPYLVAAGIGEIGIIDKDTIDITNLQRQVIYKNEAIGKSKTLEAKAMSESLNPNIKINAINENLNSDNAISLFKYYDIIIDATDNLATKYLINDACCVTSKPFVYGSVYKFEGHVSVLNYQNGPTYRCLFPEKKTEIENCNDVGVLGVCVGIIGMFQANEVLKMVLGIGEILTGKLLVYNLLQNAQQEFEFSKTNMTIIDQLSFEKRHNTFQKTILEITAEEALKTAKKASIIFLDVRNEDEYPKIITGNVIQIPLTVLESNLDKLDRNAILYVFCQSGVRSKKAVALLLEHQYKKAKCIIGGSSALELAIDPISHSIY
jgi:sulfur-carrier protein adenylyltransferase/sulfurtransferase